ncbi:hypothetical protein P4J09_29750 [Bacillus cereus]|uniref:Uncharacterized protein n=1 Tax=Bacillus cereus TaxID=1396 RepID=A0A9X6XX09_BACCE|nr:MULTISPECIES: hypothetical protein [Bacillus]KUF34934.1 hypothetical protein AMR94_00730 [Bacillus sp. G3(2015)]MEB9382155.1 hypothetical protein [Bacillus cereus]PDZ96527.1 hypothetical protein CON36_22385 [Bacillus cereus]PFJ51016.1 hypothetical protein COJ02_25570 [Bacillus thuringiensis]PFS65531.1 hypothetical protein COK87_01975 [Bacillus thuringiensis]
MTSNKKNIKQKALYGTLAASLLFSGFMVYTWDKVANDYNNLVDEYNKLKKTEGGTATTKWDSKNINKFLYHAEKMVNEAKNPLYDEMTADIILMEIKNAFLEVKQLKLPREYEDAIFWVYSSADTLQSVYTNDSFSNQTRETQRKTLEKQIEIVKELTDKYKA